MKRENYDHGFPQADWGSGEGGGAAGDDRGRPGARGLIAYSELVANIRALDLEPQSTDLAHMLGEISTDEHQAGRRHADRGGRAQGGRRDARLGILRAGALAGP